MHDKKKMTQVSTKSATVQNPSLNIFDVPSTNYILVESCYVPVNPFTTGKHPIDFQIDPQEDFINLAKSYFEVELQFKLDNNGNIANDTLVTISDNLIHSFKQINVCLNGTLISPQTDKYHHKAFIDTVIHNDRDNDDFKALSADKQNWVKSSKLFVGVKKWCLGLNVTQKCFNGANRATSEHPSTPFTCAGVL